MSFLTQSHQVFFGHPICLIPSTSHVTQYLTQSLSFRSVCPNHHNLLFLIITLTGSNPKSSLELFTLLSFIHINPSHSSNHTHFSAIQLTFIGRVSLPCISPQSIVTLPELALRCSVLCPVLVAIRDYIQ